MSAGYLLLCDNVHFLEMEKKIWSTECKYFEINIHLTDIDANVNRYFE